MAKNATQKTYVVVDINNKILGIFDDKKRAKKVAAKTQGATVNKYNRELAMPKKSPVENACDVLRDHSRDFMKNLGASMLVGMLDHAFNHAKHPRDLYRGDDDDRRDFGLGCGRLDWF